MVGIGAKDDLAFAENFVARTGTTFTMLWSDSIEPWRHFDVTSNSSVRVLDAGGNLADDSPGRFDVGKLSDQLAALT